MNIVDEIIIDEYEHIYIMTKLYEDWVGNYGSSYGDIDEKSLKLLFVSDVIFCRWMSDINTNIQIGREIVDIIKDIFNENLEKHDDADYHIKYVFIVGLLLDFGWVNISSQRKVKLNGTCKPSYNMQDVGLDSNMYIAVNDDMIKWFIQWVGEERY